MSEKRRGGAWTEAARNDEVACGVLEEGATFDALMAEVMTTAERFGHREHVHLTGEKRSRSEVL
jgi:hypothetical protein